MTLEEPVSLGTLDEMSEMKLAPRLGFDSVLSFSHRKETKFIIKKKPAGMIKSGFSTKVLFIFREPHRWLGLCWLIVET